MFGATLVAFGGAGCFLSKDESTSSSPDEINGGGDTSMVLKSVLFLQGGCLATKVGPKHLLVSARCVSGNAAYAAGKVVAFDVASSGTNDVATEEELRPQQTTATDAGKKDAAPVADAGAPRTDAGSKDASAEAPRPAGARTVTIEQVKIPPSYAAQCATDCVIGNTQASDAPDVALLIIEDEIATVPTLPIDLDAVGQGDPLLALASGCEKITELREYSNLSTLRTRAAPARVVNHDGSPYKTAPQLVGQLGAGYIVSPGIGWREREPKACKDDFGAPVFRGGQAAVVGVLSNATLYPNEKSPVTLHYTRVDSTNRFKMGAWLKDLGVETIRSCSEAPGGCVKREWEGGVPTTEPQGSTTTPSGDSGPVIPPSSDAGGAADDDAGELPPPPPGTVEEPLPPSNDESSSSVGEEPDWSDAAVPRKKKSKDEGGCSAAPGRSSTDGVAIGLGLAIALAAVRRRKR